MTRRGRLGWLRAILSLLLLAGCGFVPTESKLVGSWQVDWHGRRKLVYSFQKDHTFTIAIAGHAGALQGTWKLENGVLTTTMGSFAAYGVTNTMTMGFGSEKMIVTRLTDSAMSWRVSLLGGNLKLKRVSPASAVAQPAL